MTSGEATEDPTTCPCGHAVMWHHERRGCGYHGYSDRNRCRCHRTVEDAVRELMSQAWDEGREALGLDMTRPIGDDGMRPSTPNPYRPTPETSETNEAEMAR